MRNILKSISFVYLTAFGMAFGLYASAVGGQGNPLFVQQQGRTRVRQRP